MVHCFLFADRIVPDGNATICLCIHLLMDIWIVNKFRLLKNKAVFGTHSRTFCGQIFSFLLGKYSGVVAGLCGRSTFKFTGTMAIVFQWLHHFIPPPAEMAVQVTQHPHQNLTGLIFFFSSLFLLLRGQSPIY